jgi:hypothetical protein
MDSIFEFHDRVSAFAAIKKAPVQEACIASIVHLPENAAPLKVSSPSALVLGCEVIQAVGSKSAVHL